MLRSTLKERTKTGEKSSYSRREGEGNHRGKKVRRTTRSD